MFRAGVSPAVSVHEWKASRERGFKVLAMLMPRLQLLFVIRPALRARLARRVNAQETALEGRLAESIFG